VVQNIGAVSNESDLIVALRDRFPADVAALDEDERREALDRALGPDVAWPDFTISMVAPGGWSAERVGTAGYADSWNDWLAPFASFRVEFEDVLEGPDGVVQFVRQIGLLAGSQAPLENAGAAVFKFREGRIARIEFHLDRGDALRSAGLDPQSSQP
jgi:ketosteroid isomerase-like protein